MERLHIFLFIFTSGTFWSYYSLDLRSYGQLLFLLISIIIFYYYNNMNFRWDKIVFMWYLWWEIYWENSSVDAQGYQPLTKYFWNCIIYFIYMPEGINTNIQYQFFNLEITYVNWKIWEFILYLPKQLF
jgi:hypothetical protein